MLDSIIIEPEQPAFGTVIFLHGLNISPKDLSAIVPHMQLLDVRWVLPQAPTRPITIYGGDVSPAWYDITTLEESTKRETFAHIVESEVLIQQLIEAEIAKGIPSKNIFLMGYSEGGAMALHVAHHLDYQLLGVIVMSGYLLQADRFGSGNICNRMTPFYFYHGSRDMVVQIRRGEEAFEATKDAHPVCRWREYPVGHEICLEELREVRFALHTHFNHVRGTSAPEG